MQTSGKSLPICRWRQRLLNKKTFGVRHAPKGKSNHDRKLMQIYGQWRTNACDERNYKSEKGEENQDTQDVFRR